LVPFVLPVPKRNGKSLQLLASVGDPNDWVLEPVVGLPKTGKKDAVVQLPDVLLGAPPGSNKSLDVLPNG